MKKNVLLLETVADEAMDLLNSAASAGEIEIFTVWGEKTQTEILAENSIHAVITRGKGQGNKQLMEACPALQVIARCGVGLDNVDVKEASARAIKVVNAPGSNSSTIAEHAITLMLMLQRNFYESARQVKAGNWEWRNQFDGDELQGKTLGVLGMGNIGKRVAKLGDAFQMNVVYWDKFPVQSAYQALPLEEVLSVSDIVTLHLPLFEDTKNLIGEKELSLMKPTAMLVNTARGALVDQAALINALNSGAIAGFGADVLVTEPPAADEPLLSHPKTIITAHVGSLTATTYRNMCVSTVKNVLAILAGHAPQPESIFNRKDLNL
ncbi:2-hydroxyacid dehydrogenase [Emticicia sp. TH156]|uniref:2-hydroxyacid dehydrogenase n=1 Tax=Emticicia sp. TH156 TaxID=2067454 RepID=UPI000C75D31B|nr:hydroxyacid dehydrogenase [Emticicia sp. TH156]PLK46019.1 phosphoglycerate dehydrogenase [Emticicia sp. TH156]